MWKSFDVGSVVRSLSFSGAQVAAGEAGMGRTVRRARLAANVEILRRAAPAELVVVTATTLLDTGEAPDHLISRLEGAQIAGIAVRMDTPESLPGPLLDTATALALPVVTFPAGTLLAHATAAVLDGLLEAQRESLDRVLDTHQRFTRIVAAGGGVPEIATALHSLLQVPILVRDAEDRPVVAVPASGDTQSEQSGPVGVRMPVSAGDHSYGEVIVVTDDRLDDDQQVAVEQAATAMAVRFAQATAITATEERFAALTLEELVSGHASDPAVVAERASTLGWDMTRPRAVLLASIDPADSGPPPTSALGTIAAAARATLGPNAIVWTRSVTVAALLAPETDDPAERRRAAEDLRDELDVRLRSVTVSIGVGRRAHAAVALARSFQEATKAVEVGRWAKGRHVTQIYDDLGLERLLAGVPGDELTSFVAHTIGPLLAHDRDHNTDLTETLEAWLGTRNMAEAARQVFVHYNTMKNRLDRIGAIVGPVTTDAAQSLECEVAIYITRHYDGPWTDS